MQFAADLDLKPGDVVGDYRVEEKLGKGGFGTVFKAVHPLIGKQVAIKVLKPELSANPDMVSRFMAEAAAVNKIRHRHIIDIFTFGRLPDGRQYYVMELLAGTTLDRYLRERGPLSLEQAVPILMGVARALDAAHAAGIVHRDLKPENIFIADDDGTPFPKLLDFGLAKLLHGGVPGHKTESGVPMGTPSYMSPEQCRGRAVDHRTDYYALGVVTYQVLTGRLPITGADFMDIVLKQISERPPAPSSCRELPEGVDEAVLRMLEKEPTARPVSAVGAIEAIEDAARKAGLAISSQRPIRAPHVSAEERHAIASAETPVIGDLGTPKIPSHVAGEATPSVKPQPPRRSSSAFVVGLAVAAAAGAVVFFLVRRAAPPPPAPAPSPSPSAPAPASASASAPAPSPSPSPTPPATIHLTFTGPSGTRILSSSGSLLGQLPTTLDLPRADQPVELRFEAPGRVPETRQVDVTHDAEIAVDLKPKKRPTRPAAGQDDGEIPPF